MQFFLQDIYITLRKIDIYSENLEYLYTHRENLFIY